MYLLLLYAFSLQYSFSFSIVISILISSELGCFVLKSSASRYAFNCVLSPQPHSLGWTSRYLITDAFAVNKFNCLHWTRKETERLSIWIVIRFTFWRTLWCVLLYFSLLMPTLVSLGQKIMFYVEGWGWENEHRDNEVIVTVSIAISHSHFLFGQGRDNSCILAFAFAFRFDGRQRDYLQYFSNHLPMTPLTEDDSFGKTQTGC